MALHMYKLVIIILWLLFFVTLLQKDENWEYNFRVCKKAETEKDNIYIFKRNNFLSILKETNEYWISLTLTAAHCMEKGGK